MKSSSVPIGFCAVRREGEEGDVGGGERGSGTCRKGGKVQGVGSIQRRGAESSGTKGVAVSNRGLVQVKEIMIKV